MSAWPLPTRSSTPSTRSAAVIGGFFVVSSTLLLQCAACGVRAPQAMAEPRHTPPRPSDAPDEPVVRGELKDDADVVRALRESYTKYEHAVPMRDGVKLHTSVFAPKDRSRSYPILMIRTPYGVGPYGQDAYPNSGNKWVVRRLAPSAAFVKEGYILVHQDVRGRMMSEGAFVDVRPRAQKKGETDEATDAWDTIDWLVKNVPGNNGKVGLWGVSYPGFYAAQAAIDAHPALAAISPQAPVTEWFLGDDFHHNGAMMLAQSFDFFASFGKPRPAPVKNMTWGFDYDGADLYDFFLALGPVANANTKHFKNEIAFWNDCMAHGTRDDFWKARDPRPHYKVKPRGPAVMTVGGWFDAEDLWGALETYKAFERQSPGADNVLVMGPWRHGGWSRSDGDKLGDVTFGQKTAQHYRDQVELPFFQKHLKGKAHAAPPEALVFETGTNTWQRFSAWPPPEAKPVTLFTREKGGLSTTPAPEAGADEYPSDPARPVPYRARPGGDVDGDYMTDDQRFASRRPDVVSFSTPVLASDVVVCGAIEASLWVTVTGTDADFVVKLVDVYPSDYPDPDPNPSGVKMGGYQQLVRAEIMRGKFRESFERPAPFKPGEPTLVRFGLPDTCHAFRRGHKLMVQVQSSWFPLVDRNPQTFVDVYKAQESDFKAATHRVLRGGERGSSVRLAVLRGSF